MNSNDIELLRRYVFERSESAFADLVQQHIGLVYSAALRQTNGDAPLAEDITQVVFTDLARKAARLTRHTSLAGWRYTSTRYAAAALRRAEHRRSAREQEAHAMNQLMQSAEIDPAWEQLRPVLDEAMHDLKADDREAVLLRYFERLPLAAVGARLGVTENTARMRVDRALDKLRGALVKRGVTSTAGALAVILTGRVAGAAPAWLAAAVSGKAVATAGAASALSVLLARFLIAAKLKLVTGTAVLVAIAIPVVWHWEGSGQRAPALPPSVEPAAADAMAQTNAASPEATQATLADSAAMTNTSALRLTILAADANKPVATVEVECTAKKDKQQNREKFVSRRDGICNVYYPKDTDGIELVSRTDGFADTVLHWEPAKGDTIPTNYVLRLIRAVHIGGYVREENGSPVPGAKVEFNRSIARVDPAAVLAHENHEFRRIETVADAAGRWSLDRIAPDMLWRTTGFVMEPEYLIKVVALDNIDEKGAQELLREGRFVFTLSRGVTVQGMIVDTQGKAVPKTKVVVGKLGRGEFRDTIALDDGSFVVKACRPEDTCVAVSAKGFAGKVLNLKLEADPTPLNIILEAGHALRLKVVDQAGRPVAKATLSANQPGSVLAWLGKTDTNGIVNAQAPAAGTMTVRVEASGYALTEAEVTGDSQEHLIKLTKETVLSGTVTDATTGRPVRQFRIICGTPHFGNPFSTNASFAPSPMSEDWLKFGNGMFRLAMKNFLDHTGDVQERGFLIKFEADGYAPCVSRLIRCDEGEVQLDAALRPANSIKVTVVNPNGRPAAKAEVGLLGEGTPLTLLAGRLEANFGSGLLRTDSEGAFQLPPDQAIERVIAMNPQGFAIASPSALAGEPTLQLQPFGRLEGRWLVRNQPAPQKRLVLYYECPGTTASLGLNGNAVSATTDVQGHFVFPQVPPGKFRLTWPVPEGNGVTTMKPVAEATVRPGETATVTIGEGYVVSLRLRWPDDLALAKSTRSGVFMHTPGPEPPALIMHDSQALAQWAQSPEIQARMHDVRGYEFVEGTDGVWTADGVQAGTTDALESRAMDVAATNGFWVFIAYGQTSVTIPAEPSTGQIDAGELVLQRAKPSAVRVEAK